MLQFSISITVTAMRLKMVQTFKFISNSSSFHSQQSLSLKNTTAKTIQKQNNITTIPKLLYSSLFYYILFVLSPYLSQPWMSWILAMVRHSFLRESGKRPSQSQRRPGRRLRNQRDHHHQEKRKPRRKRMNRLKRNDEKRRLQRRRMKRFNEKRRRTRRKHLKWQKVSSLNSWTFQPELTLDPWSINLGSRYDPWMN